MTNDVSILATIVIILFSVGVITPMITSEFSSSTDSNDIEGFVDDTSQGIEPSVTTVLTSPVSFVIQGIKMIFWSWGEVPFFINIILWSMRFVAMFIFIRLVRGTG